MFIVGINIISCNFEQHKFRQTLHSCLLWQTHQCHQNRTDDGILAQIKGYVQENVVIYTLDDGKKELDTSKWKKSTTENIYYHDINHAGKSIPKIVSDIRAPLYFTVPVASEGEHRWIAKLGEKETSTSTPVTLTVETFYATYSDVEIVTKDYTSCSVLRTLKYKNGVFPDVQKLLRLVDYKGMKFISSADKVYVSMIHSSKGHKLGAFIEYKQTGSIRVAKPGHYYWHSELVLKGVSTGQQTHYDCDCCDDSLDLTSAQVEKVWNEGIAMLLQHDWSLEIDTNDQGLINFECNDFILEDNFGNRMKCGIDWDDGDWYRYWKVTDIAVVYP